MPTIDCLILQADRLLMIRRQEGARRSGRLLAVGGHVEPGESPLEACVREVLKETGLHVSPSCVAVVSNLGLAPDDYRLIFVAQLAGDRSPATPESGELEWVELGQLPDREDVSRLDRELIPRLLASGHPLSVIVSVDTSTEPEMARVLEVAPMDLARLSPLVFAVLE